MVDMEINVITLVVGLLGFLTMLGIIVYWTKEDEDKDGDD